MLLLGPHHRGNRQQAARDNGYDAAAKKSCTCCTCAGEFSIGAWPHSGIWAKRHLGRRGFRGGVTLGGRGGGGRRGPVQLWVGADLGPRVCISAAVSSNTKSDS